MFRFLHRQHEPEGETDLERSLLKENRRLRDDLADAEDRLRTAESDLRIALREVDNLAAVIERDRARVEAETAIAARSVAEAKGVTNARA